MYIMHWLPVIQVHVMTEISLHAPYVLFHKKAKNR